MPSTRPAWTPAAARPTIFSPAAAGWTRKPIPGPLRFHRLRPGRPREVWAHGAVHRQGQNPAAARARDHAPGRRESGDGRRLPAQSHRLRPGHRQLHLRPEEPQGRQGRHHHSGGRPGHLFPHARPRPQGRRLFRRQGQPRHPLRQHRVRAAKQDRGRLEGAGKVPYLPKPWGGYLTGFVATATIDRMDFGMSAYPSGLSHKVRVRVEIEGAQASS
ncbi:hypothetical protein THIX_10535 [Thiomonas sp. X19]|nr:hypothetical protein THIX_10535 [Thiomonas sp. X19]